ncbi:hypothetical protein LPJ57_003304 [Coemansia sp. RSA 486]|nr:hypothetical protein LPJ57_003304 [Coemansia sp. RSA 486]
MHNRRHSVEMQAEQKKNDICGILKIKRKRKTTHQELVCANADLHMAGCHAILQMLLNARYVGIWAPIPRLRQQAKQQYVELVGRVHSQLLWHRSSLLVAAHTVAKVPPLAAPGTQ